MPTLQLERVYTDDGTELSTGTVPTTLASGAADQMVYDGRYLWVTCSTGIAIYEFWGESSDNEPDWADLDELVYPRYDSGAQKKLKLITFITMTSSQIKRVTRYASLSLRPEVISSTADGSTTVDGFTCTLTTKTANLRVITEVGPNPVLTALSPKWMCMIGNKMYISNGAAFTQIFEFNIDTQRFTQMITLPVRTGSTLQVANSNLAAAGGKLWCVNTFYNDTTAQQLLRYTPGTGWGSTTIPVRPQDARAYIADGMNGFVYVTNFNNVSVSKFSTAGTFSSTIRVNAFPSRIFSDQHRRIWVVSFAGMLSLIDYDDDEVHNDYSVNDGVPASFMADPNTSTKVWWADGLKLVQHDLTDKSQLESGTGSEDWVYGGLGSSPDGLVITLPQTIPDGTSEKTMLPYALIAYSGGIAAFRFDPYMMYRVSYSEVNGQGAVVGGTLEYFGET